MVVNNRQIVAVYIRGLAFKCASGSRREQVLRGLKQQDEAVFDWVVVAGAGLAIGFLIGGFVGWYLI